MKKKKISMGLVCLFMILSLNGCIKVVKIGEEAALTGKTEFQAGDNVAEFWETEAMPELEEKAVDLAEFLSRSNGDFSALAKEYGVYSMGSSGELNYTVKGIGTVENVDVQSKAGTMTVKLDGYDGAEEVKIQVGTVIKGSSIRDSLSFIKFGDYTNQQEYAAVSQSINEIVMKDVIHPDSAKELEGKEIRFLGCFTVSDNQTVLITPVKLEAD